MNPQDGLTVAQVVQKLVEQAATLSVIVAPVTFGIIEAVKKAGLPGRFAGLLSAPIGVLIVFCIQNFSFTSFGILVGVIAGLATSGTYSAVKSAATKPKENSI